MAFPGGELMFRRDNETTVVTPSSGESDGTEAGPRRLRRGRNVRTTDDPSAVDARQISAASEIRKSECVMTVVPRSAAVSQADY